MSILIELDIGLITESSYYYAAGDDRVQLTVSTDADCNERVRMTIPNDAAAGNEWLPVLVVLYRHLGWSYLSWIGSVFDFRPGTGQRGLGSIGFERYRYNCLVRDATGQRTSDSNGDS